MNEEQVPVAEVPQEQPKQTPHELAKTDEKRRGKYNEWLLVGIQNGSLVWRYDWTFRELNQKYPPAKLRKLRKERGVGSSKVRKKLQAQMAYKASFADAPA
jgi:hypothetical protein